MKQCYIDILSSLEDGSKNAAQRYETMKALLEVFRNEDKSFYDESIETILKKGSGLNE